MNLYDMLLAKKIGGGGGSGGNPNTIQVINATLANPWGSNELAEQYQTAYESGGASAVLEFDATALGFGILINPIDENTLEGCESDGSVAYCMSFSVGTYRGDINSAVVVVSGTATDMKQYASMIPTTLTIYWHPMP